MLAIYTRLSKNDPTSNSIKNQIREGKQFAKSKPYEIYNEGEDVSGGDDIKDRPELNRLVADIYSGKITEVWFRHQDRLERNTATFLLFSGAVKKMNVKVFLNGNQTPVDYNDPSSYFQGGLMSMFNSYLIIKQSYLTKNAIKKNFELGYTHAIPPYGYTRKSDKDQTMIIDPEESKVVKEIFQMSLDGNGYRTIANELNKREIPTTYNKIGKGKKKTNSKWVGETIRGIIKNEIYKGIRRTYTKDENGNKVEGETYQLDEYIIEPYMFDMVNENLKNNMTGSPKEFHYDYLLNGVNICGVCGKPFNGRTIKGQTHQRYQCTSKKKGKNHCGNGSVRLEILNNLIWDIYFKNKHMVDLINKEYDATIHLKKMKELLDEAVQLDEAKNQQLQSKKNLVLAVANGKLKQPDIREVLDEIEAELKNIDTRIYSIKKETQELTNEMDKHLLDVNTLSDFDKAKSFEDKHNLIKEYIKEINVVATPKKHKRIYIYFNAPNIEPDVIIIDKNYNWTYEPQRNHLVDMEGEHFDDKTDVKMIQQIDKAFNYYQDLYR